MSADIIRAVENYYSQNITDEFMLPIIAEPRGRVKQHDSVIFFNFRSDRAREITVSLTDPSFNFFPVQHDLSLFFVCMTQYSKKFTLPVAFAPEKIINGITETITKTGKRVFKTAETEKYAHVTFFFNGGIETPFPGEDRILVPSPKVATYDLQPEMSAPQVTPHVLEAMSQGYDLVVVNYANGDMVGHTGIYDAAVKAVETVDAQVGAIVARAAELGMPVIITADHGNAEKMVDENGIPHTQHTTSFKVPFIIYDPLINESKTIALRNDGALQNIAPTICDIMGIQKPAEMTGSSLILSRYPIKQTRKVVLVIMDGWGINPDMHDPSNAIRGAHTPVFNRLLSTCPSTQLIPFGLAVGLPEGTMGNSEIGHLNIGAGRVIKTDYVRINDAIKDSSFFSIPSFLDTIAYCKQHTSALHIMGLCSDAGVHSHIDHGLALVQLAAQQKLPQIYVHAILDGRDTPPTSGASFLAQILERMKEYPQASLATVMGRYYAMDRDNRWDRVQKAYDALVRGV